MNKNIKKIIVAILILLIVFFLYRTFVPKNTPKSVSQSKNGLVISTGIDTQNTVPKENTEKLLNVLLSVNAIKLSTELFTKIEFISLKDFSIKEEEQRLDESFGRDNPFLPFEIGGEDLSSSSENTTALNGADASKTVGSKKNTNSNNPSGIGTGSSTNTGTPSNPNQNPIPVPNPAPAPAVL
jgi:hypothetical protein